MLNTLPTRKIFGPTQAMKERVQAKAKQVINRVTYRQRYAPSWPDNRRVSQIALPWFNWVVEYEEHEYAEEPWGQIKNKLLFVKADSKEEARQVAWQFMNAIYRIDFFDMQETIAGVKKGTPWTPRIFTILSVFPRP